MEAEWRGGVLEETQGAELSEEVTREVASPEPEATVEVS